MRPGTAGPFRDSESGSESDSESESESAPPAERGASQLRGLWAPRPRAFEYPLSHFNYGAHMKYMSVTLFSDTKDINLLQIKIKSSLNGVW